MAGAAAACCDGDEEVCCCCTGAEGGAGADGLLAPHLLQNRAVALEKGAEHSVHVKISLMRRCLFMAFDNDLQGCFVCAAQSEIGRYVERFELVFVCIHLKSREKKKKSGRTT